MNNKEKKAIKNLKDFAYTIYGTFSATEAKTILNLIAKLQKENKELDNDNVEWRAKNLMQLATIDDLQNENSMLKKVNKITKNITIEDVERAIKKAEKQYIPIQEVKELIKALKKKYIEISFFINKGEVLDMCIEELEKLLEGKK